MYHLTTISQTNRHKKTSYLMVARRTQPFTNRKRDRNKERQTGKYPDGQKDRRQKDRRQKDRKHEAEGSAFARNDKGEGAYFSEKLHKLTEHSGAINWSL